MPTPETVVQGPAEIFYGSYSIWGMLVQAIQSDKNELPLTCCLCSIITIHEQLGQRSEFICSYASHCCPALKSQKQRTIGEKSTQYAHNRFRH